MALRSARCLGGTDKTKDWAQAAGPVIVLVEPQLGENIGAAARAMGNFGCRGSASSSRAAPGPTARR